MTPYPKYKPSGIEWIGKIPIHWELKKLKYLAKILNGQDHKIVWDESGEYPILGTGGEFGKANQYLHKGPSVILGRKGTIDKPQFIETPFWSVDTAYYTNILSHTNAKFFFYCCKTILFDLYKYGSAVPSMTQETLNQIPFATPPLPEQTAIANYLDKKTAQIDTLIAKKQKLTDLLKEERTAIINEVLLKGFYSSAKLKQSNIEWIGAIPENWQIKKMRFLSKITTGAKNTEDRVEEGGYPFFVRSQTVERINSYSFDGEGILTAGDGVGVAKVFHYVNGKFDFHQRVYLFYDFSHEINPQFLFFFIQMNLEKEVLRYNAKSTVDSLRLPMLKDFPIAFPNGKDEQATIVQHIQTETQKIDNTISKIEKEIELMQEYRTALISEVVTGKVKVV